MSQNKNFQKRITILDECFASSLGAYTLDKLMQVLEEKLEVNVDYLLNLGLFFKPLF